MRHLVVLAVLAIVAAVLAALPLAHSQGLLHAGTTPSAWPCCDECGSCTRSIPPRCTCMDVSPSGCHPACKNCVKTFLGGRTVFWCMQRMKNFCERRCTPTGMIN